MLHVIGGGLSGLACAVRASLAGREVALYEAANHAGGRCRSFHDESIGRLIDNGNHMLLGANSATRAFLKRIGSGGRLTEIAPAAFPFMDLANGRQWALRPGAGRLPFWLWSSTRRVPGTGPTDYWRDVWALRRAGPDATAGDCLGESRLFDTLWQPLCRAALNTDATEASAALLWTIVAATFLKGGAACRPLIFADGLSPTLIDPAVALLRRRDVKVRFQSRLRAVERHAGRLIALHFPEGILRLSNQDAVVLAVPPETATDLWPHAPAPQAAHAIVNIHFRLDGPVTLPGGAPFLGLLNSTSQWLFVRDDVLSVTVSAADALAERPGWEIATEIWSECARALGRNVGRTPPWRVIKERRATFAQTPAELKRRPGAATALGNLFLAGDWTATGLPATIEGSIRSGFVAADAALAAMARDEAEESVRR